MKRPADRRDKRALIVLCLWAVLAPGICSQAGPTLPREGVRWHYERALVLEVQEQTGRALAALHRALDAADERRRALQRAIKAALAADSHPALEQLERTAYDRRLAGSPEQRQAQRRLADEFDRLAAVCLSPAELAEWRSLPLQTAECRYLMAHLYWRNDRVADVILVLTQVVDVAALPDHVPARLLLAQAYSRLGTWEHALPHLEALAAAFGLSEPEAQQALRFLKTALARQTPPPDAAQARAALRTLTTAVENACSAQPATYRKLMLGGGLKDPVAYLELAHLCAEADEQRDDVRTVLAEAIEVREGFFPVAWLALGEAEETRAAELEAAGHRPAAIQAYQSAAKAFETAFQQLEQLDFLPERDFEPARLQALRRKLAALQE